MLQALKLAAAGVVALLCLSAPALAEYVAKPDFTQGDAEKGKKVYQLVAICSRCHGWAGDGGAGRNPMEHAQGADLRVTKMDAQTLYDTVRCGIPGTQMPYHDGASYKDDRCNGLMMSDFAAGQAPKLGKTLSEKQMVDLIAYLEKYVVNHGTPTYEDCALYYDANPQKNCAYLKGGN